MEAPWLPGYEGSSPVRIGNAASNQMQLDVFGELLDAFYHTYLNGLPPADRVRPIIRSVLDYLSKIWFEPDKGIWEVRGPPQHFTHSKVMAWVASTARSKSLSASTMGFMPDLGAIFATKSMPTYAPRL